MVDVIQPKRKVLPPITLRPVHQGSSKILILRCNALAETSQLTEPIGGAVLRPALEGATPRVGVHERRVGT